MMNATQQENPKILMISLRDQWLGSCRLPRALASQGFCIEALCRPSSYLASTRYIERFYWMKSQWNVFSRLVLLKVLVTIYRSRPDLLLAGDEDAVLVLIDLARFSRLWPDRWLAELLRRSLWDKTYHGQIIDKQKFVRLLHSWQLPTPRTYDLALLADSSNEPWTYPVVLKGSFGSGGSGVTICPDASTLHNQAEKLAKPPKSALKAMIKRWLFYDIYSLDAAHELQEFIAGTSGLFPFVAWQGKLLAGFALLRLKTYPNSTGPSSVVQSIDLPELRQTLEQIVQRIGFSGFGSFDFMYHKSTGKAYVIELNPRPVPASHFPEDVSGVSLSKCLYQAMQGLAVPTSTFKSFTVAMFPGEFKRDPHSEYLSSAYHDVPWDDEHLLESIFPGYSKVNSRQDQKVQG